VFENRVLRRIFGPLRKDVTGDCRKLHNEVLYNFYNFSDNCNDKVKDDEMSSGSSTKEE
jgi:hypothetical protein